MAQHQLYRQMIQSHKALAQVAAWQQGACYFKGTLISFWWAFNSFLVYSFHLILTNSVASNESGTQMTQMAQMNGEIIIMALLKFRSISHLVWERVSNKKRLDIRD